MASVAPKIYEPLSFFSPMIRIRELEGIGTGQCQYSLAHYSSTKMHMANLVSMAILLDLPIPIRESWDGTTVVMLVVEWVR